MQSCRRTSTLQDPSKYSTYLRDDHAHRKSAGRGYASFFAQCPGFEESGTTNKVETGFAFTIRRSIKRMMKKGKSVLHMLQIPNGPATAYTLPCLADPLGASLDSTGQDPERRRTIAIPPRTTTTELQHYLT
ncbi:hypothetical protein HO173_009044 [Letharia columbiana]|uniref:Uncharacterized protein n=1 Tax=Letharia columbiana TaxID=112416 RepID=A0A8H6FQG3_9LECA|nr:uncharacterized protein HO173_009044 [Letharia columbiana]KAF6232829.1 hypothetical protein HO173_009044 [Letharia columbiana]